MELAGRYAELLSGSRLLTSDEWADYLLYRNYPRQRVFFDGRSDFYGQALGEDYLKLMNGRPAWRTLLASYGFEAALLPVEWPLASMLKNEPGWRILEDDGKAILFQKQP